MGHLGTKKKALDLGPKKISKQYLLHGVTLMKSAWLHYHKGLQMMSQNINSHTYINVKRKVKW